MKILVEALCAEFGGIRTYVEHLLRAWPVEFPDDELHVIVRDDSDLPLGPTLHRHAVSVPPLGPLGRPIAQTRHLRRLTRELRPDAVLATLPSTTSLRVDAPMAVVVYDLRHALRPEQFSRQTRILRAISYRRGYALADGIISISQRSLDDLHELHPRTRSTPAVVAHLGADHVDDWTASPSDDSRPIALAFAHQSNKNTDLLLAAWQQLAEAGEAPASLLVLGLDAGRRAEMAADLDRRGLTNEVRLAPFVSDEEFSGLFAGADVIVFPSDFEGFGLPVPEGMRLGVPVVIGPEKATQEVAGGHAVVMDSWTAGDLASAVVRALALTPEQRAEAQRFAERYTWAATARTTRKMLTDLVAGRSAAISTSPQGA